MADFRTRRFYAPALNIRIALGFLFIAVIFLLMVLDYIFYGHGQKSISCCGSQVCTEQRHHQEGK
jgi:hypothetical protein